MWGSSPMPSRLPGMGEDSEATHVAPVEQAVNREMLAAPHWVTIQKLMYWCDPSKT